MDLTPTTQPLSIPDASSYFVWEPADKQIAIQMGGDVVDHINHEVMRGFGAVPKRGAEVGGLLLGTVEKGEKCVVRIEEFVSIPCEHLRGPSYILSDSDLPALDRELAERSADSGGPSHVVGFFRSNTREPMQLTEDDQALLEARFPGDDVICLLVRPFATRPGEAVFLTRENGRFSGEAQSGAFVFRRKEMNLAPAPRRVRMAPDGLARSAESPQPELPVADGAQAAEPEFPLMGRRRYGRASRPVVPETQPGGSAAEFTADVRPLPGGQNAEPLLRGSAAPSETPWGVRPAPAKHSLWVWAPLCFVFLVLGILIGVGVTLTMSRTHSAAPNADPYRLDLGVSRFGESCHLAWNPESPALRQARGGELLIEEGGVSKTQQLSPNDLSRGGIIYRGAAAPVRFRLTVFLRDRAEFSESVESQSTAQ